jgi:hypothetical protein
MFGAKYGELMHATSKQKDDIVEVLLQSIDEDDVT